MSALPPKADICSALAYVRFGPKADSCIAAIHARLRTDIADSADVSSAQRSLDSVARQRQFSDALASRIAKSIHDRGDRGPPANLRQHRAISHCARKAANQSNPALGDDFL
jgi:hypothetical protein